MRGSRGQIIGVGMVGGEGIEGFIPIVGMGEGVVLLLREGCRRKETWMSDLLSNHEQAAEVSA